MVDMQFDLGRGSDPLVWECHLSVLRHLSLLIGKDSGAKIHLVARQVSRLKGAWQDGSEGRDQV
ncbi:hypothetical protein GCM10011575_19680 [Microlunatus endophyticus]|uniref:Uncharacterized protein n=1 Tax=Microlunatus endophyticus TaxID=1716077 RepID=A0A917S6E8_9ACTN|nr:hypothetical protein GCM10011575_19680 [Microlunatus endophyticus]